MAKRQRVRAARAQRRSVRDAERATVEKVMQRYHGRLMSPEAENELLIHKARMVGNRKARILRKTAARLAKARATGWARGMTLGTGVIPSAAARAYAA